jgi:hypothetical protein
MHPKVVSAEAWGIARKLVEARLTEGWVLAGGTGLALQLGHRVSEDFDFFRVGAFESEALAHALSRVAPVTVQGRSEGTLHVVLGGLRVSFLSAQVPLLFAGTPYRGLVLADPRDIAVMKVVAIGGRGSRKDFVDLYFFLRGGSSLEAVFRMIRQRFASVDFNEYHLLRALSYFEDAETEPLPRLLRRASWPEIKAAIVAEVRRLS